MNRYFYYLVGLGMLLQIVSSISSVLYESRESGAIMSLIVSLFAGVLIIFLIAKFFIKFPGKGLPELLKSYTSRWVSYPLLTCLFLVWYTIGLKTLISYSFLLKRFLTPHMPLWGIVVTLLVFISFGMLMKSQRVLHTVELIFLLSLPFILFIMVKLYINRSLEWDFIKESLMYVYHLPDYTGFSASLFTFIGAASLIILNREFKKKQKMTMIQLIFIFIFGAGVLFTTYFIPIGYNGFDYINTLTYPWLTTSDSLRIGFAFLERVMYIFMLLYLATAFLGMIISWHVALEVLKSTFWFRNLIWKKRNLTPYLFIILIWIVSIAVTTHLTEHQSEVLTIYLYNAMPPLYLVFILVGFIISRRAKACKTVLRKETLFLY